MVHLVELALQPIEHDLRAADGVAEPPAGRAALLGRRYLSKRCLSNAVSFVYYGITCLIRLIKFAALF